MTKTVAYKKIQKFIDLHIKPRIEYTDTNIIDPHTTDYARNVENQYVRFVWAGLAQFIKPCNRVTSKKCLTFLYWLKTSANRFIDNNCHMYDFKRIANKRISFYAKTIEQNIEMFQEWFVMEFKGEVGID